MEVPMSTRKHLFCLVVMVASLVLYVPSGMLAKEKSNEATSWLAAHSDPPKINVSGTWNSEKWGDIVLYRDAASGQLKGHADEWHIHGVVSGNRVFLLFISFGEVKYSAILTAENDGNLDGSYSKRLLSEGNSGEPMHLTRIDKGSRTQPPATSTDAQSDTGLAALVQPTAKIVVYRPHAFIEHSLKPYIILDNECMAWIPDRTYMTLLVTPGKHTIMLARSVGATVLNMGIGGTHGYPLLVYANAEETSYAAVDVDSWSGIFSARLTEPEEARREMRKLSPAKVEVIDPEVSDRVSVEPDK
jgi:hypothetical protein